MVAVPLVTVQLTKVYHVVASAVTGVAAPWATATGELGGAVIMPPAVTVTVN
jgi:hypothetical protein